MRPSAGDSLRLQENEHPLVFSDRFESIEAYCLFLMHMRAYEEAAQRSTGLAVLDLGCNNGYGTSQIAASSASVIGCDVSESALSDARKRFPNIDFRRIDGLSLPFADGQFDVVISFQVIEHVDDTAVYLAEICRVLKFPGTAIFTTPNAAIRLDPGMRPWNRFHVREYRAHELSQTLRETFVEVNLRGLFASEELYQIEYRRCQRALEMNRQPLRPLPPQRIRSYVTAFVKEHFPVWAVNRLRRLKEKPRTTVAEPQLDPEVQRRFSTSQLHYAEGDLDRALDFMAICTKGPSQSRHSAALEAKA